MKKITLLLLALVAFNFGKAQFTEDFSGTTFPPTGWTVYPGANGLGTVETWQINDTAAPAFTLCLWEAVTAGQFAEDWLVTPQIAINATQNVLTFDATDFNQGEYGSQLSIRVSTTSQTDTTTFTEIENLDESELGNNATTAFSNFSVDLASYLNQSVYIAFVLVQNDGDAVGLDNVEVIQGAAAAPGPANTPTPADMATGVVVDINDNDADGSPDNSVAFTWSPDASLGAVAPDEYEFLLGDSPTTLVSLGTAPATTTFPVNIQGFTYNTTYYWQIIPKNTAGSATGNPVWSFTTEMGTITAPSDCGSPTPADMATNVTVDTANSNAVSFSWIPAIIGDAPESYLFLLGDSPTTLNTLGATANTSVDITGMQTGTTYYWQIQPRNVGGTNETGPVWSFTTEGTASIDEETQSLFTISPNPTTDILNISTEETIEKVTIYNGLGQLISENVKVLNNQINVSALSTGLYILKLESDKESQSIRFIKE